MRISCKDIAHAEFLSNDVFNKDRWINSAFIYLLMLSGTYSS